MSLIRACDICGIGDKPTNRVLRFGLRRDYRTADGKMRARSLGGLDLCRECWERTGRPRMRPACGRRKPILTLVDEVGA